MITHFHSQEIASQAESSSSQEKNSSIAKKRVDLAKRRIDPRREARERLSLFRRQVTNCCSLVQDRHNAFLLSAMHNNVAEMVPKCPKGSCEKAAPCPVAIID